MNTLTITSFPTDILGIVFSQDAFSLRDIAQFARVNKECQRIAIKILTSSLFIKKLTSRLSIKERDCYDPLSKILKTKNKLIKTAGLVAKARFFFNSSASDSDKKKLLIVEQDIARRIHRIKNIEEEKRQKEQPHNYLISFENPVIL